MLIEILSLFFYIYYWMTWLQRGNMMPDMDEIRDMLEQAQNGGT